MDHADCPVVSSKPSDPQQRRPDGRMYFVETAELLVWKLYSTVVIVITGQSRAVTTCHSFMFMFLALTKRPVHILISKASLFERAEYKVGIRLTDSK